MRTLISLLIRWIGNSYFSLTFDKVLPAHPQVTLIEVDNPLGRVLDVSRNREIEEVVCAVSLRSEAIVQLLPGINER